MADQSSARPLTVVPWVTTVGRMWPIDNDVTPEPVGVDPEIWVQLHTGAEVPLGVLYTTTRLLMMLAPHTTLDMKLFVVMPKHDLHPINVELLRTVGLLDKAGHMPLEVQQILEACVGDAHRVAWASPADGWPEGWW